MTPEEKKKAADEFETEMLLTARKLVEAIQKGGYKAGDDVAVDLTALALISAIIAVRVKMPMGIWVKVCANVWAMANHGVSELEAAMKETVH